MLMDDTTTMRDSSRIHVEERGDEQRHDLPPSQKSSIKVKLTLNIIKQYIRYDMDLYLQITGYIRYRI